MKNMSMQNSNRLLFLVLGGTAAVLVATLAASHI